MCGINGFNFNDRELIDRMNAATAHRGPDGTGIFSDTIVTLGHNLLAITETPELSQGPYATDDGKFVLAYNGEIYNYLQLREKMEAKGESFRTQSDTEVLLKGLRLFGIDFVRDLDGMFAFAFYDREARRLYVARDPSGMKPVYFSFRDSRFAFSSEVRGLLKSIEPKLNHDALGVFFTLGYVPGHRTLFEGIEKLRPGHYLDFDLSSKKMQDVAYVVRDTAARTTFEPEHFRAMIRESVRRHTMGRRPYGLYLSGGLDSTIILHELAKQGGTVKTYTTRFSGGPEELNEDAHFARRLCDDYDIEHHEVDVTEDNFIDAFDLTFRTIEEPRYHISAPAYFLLAQRASQDIVVVLSGNGGDELFFGYDRYIRSHALLERVGKYPPVVLNTLNTVLNWRRGTTRLGHLVRMGDPLVRWAYLNKIRPIIGSPAFSSGRFDFVDLANSLRADAAPVLADPLADKDNIVAELDRLFWLADEEFIRTDKIAMHFGMEGRFPFLAREIVDYANSIPGADKLAGGATKALVRQAYRGHLPDYIVDKEKTGWYAPTIKWLKSDLGELVRATLDRLYYPGTADLFDLDYIRTNYFDGVDDFTRSNIKKFMPIVAFQMWAKSYSVTL